MNIQKYSEYMEIISHLDSFYVFFFFPSLLLILLFCHIQELSPLHTYSIDSHSYYSPVYITGCCMELSDATDLCILNRKINKSLSRFLNKRSV